MGWPHDVEREEPAPPSRVTRIVREQWYTTVVRVQVVYNPRALSAAVNHRSNTRAQRGAHVYLVLFWSMSNANVVTARLTDEEARMLVALALPTEKTSSALRRLIREAHERSMQPRPDAGR